MKRNSLGGFKRAVNDSMSNNRVRPAPWATQLIPGLLSGGAGTYFILKIAIPGYEFILKIIVPVLFLFNRIRLTPKKMELNLRQPDLHLMRGVGG